VGTNGTAALETLLVGSLLLAGVLYIHGVVRLWRKAGAGQGIGLLRAASFTLGWLTTAVALLGPLDQHAATEFTAHMLQHELLMAVAAPLLILGHPLAVWSWALPGVARAWSSVWRRPRVRGAWALAAGLPCAWLAHSIALWAWHVPAPFMAALANPYVHAIEHASFLFTGTLFWTAAIGRRRPDAVLYLFLFMLHSSVLGTLLAMSPSPWYPVYQGGIEDQQLGGLIMWIPGSTVYAFAALWALAGRLQRHEGNPITENMNHRSSQRSHRLLDSHAGEA
jgi:putative membrane protein